MTIRDTPRRAEMSPRAKVNPRSVCALGVSPHSGWAVVVALGEIDGTPQVLERLRIEIFDKCQPESKQPYHAVESVALAEATRRLDGYLKTAHDMAREALTQLTARLVARGHRAKRLGVLDSSGRKGHSLPAILASHSLIHTADGDHFRGAIATAAQRLGLEVCRVPLRELETRAQTSLEQSAVRLRSTVSDLGRSVGPPWGADQKMAALFAWMLLQRTTP